jgi:hypothetical protein
MCIRIMSGIMSDCIQAEVRGLPGCCSQAYNNYNKQSMCQADVMPAQDISLLDQCILDTLLSETILCAHPHCSVSPLSLFCSQPTRVSMPRVVPRLWTHLGMTCPHCWTVVMLMCVVSSWPLHPSRLEPGSWGFESRDESLCTVQHAGSHGSML